MGDTDRAVEAGLREAIDSLHDLERLPDDKHSEWYVGWHRAVDAAAALASSRPAAPDSLDVAALRERIESLKTVTISPARKNGTVRGATRKKAVFLDDVLATLPSEAR